MRTRLLVATILLTTAAITAPQPEWAAIARLTRGAGTDCPWLASLHRQAAAHLADPDPDLLDALRALAVQAHDMAWAMQFGFLLDPDRKLLSIGFAQSENTRDAARRSSQPWFCTISPRTSPRAIASSRPGRRAGPRRAHPRPARDPRPGLRPHRG